MKPYEGKLSDEERKALQRMVSSGSGAARAIRRAQMLLTSEEGWTERALFYTDHYTVYKGVIPPAQHRAISKLARKTNHVERFNCTLRQRVSRLVRSTLSFSKKLSNHVGAIKYFICDYNLTRSAELPA